MKVAIHEKSVPHCREENCDGLVKPEIVFFGEQLPEEFLMNKGLPAEADLCIIMGTSLSVFPFAALPQFCTESTPRVLINQEQVGSIGSRTDDVCILGDCDSGVRKLAEACGWLEELEKLWAKTSPDQKPLTEKQKAKKSRDEKLQDEVEQLTREVEESLKLGEAQHKWLENHVDNKFAQVKQEDGTVLFSGESNKVEKLDLGEEQHKSLEDQLGAKFTKIQDGELTNPATKESDNVLRAAASSADTAKNDPGGDLQHVFPHLKKSSL